MMDYLRGELLIDSETPGARNGDEVKNMCKKDYNSTDSYSAF